MSEPNDTIKVSRADPRIAEAYERWVSAFDNIEVNIAVDAFAGGYKAALITLTPQEQPRRFTDEERRELQACVCEIPCDCCNILKAMLAESAPEGEAAE